MLKKVFLLAICNDCHIVLAAPESLGSCAEGNCVGEVGVFEYDNGDVFYGSFAASYRHGDGIQSYNITNRSLSAPKKYDGEWSVDIYDGKGCVRVFVLAYSLCVVIMYMYLTSLFFLFLFLFLFLYF
tara:strand:- start:731 stop:1111 length:381 start_codon:yes stop_codon:yes gene_type:complete